MDEWIGVQNVLPVVGQEVMVRLENGEEVLAHRNYAGVWVVPRGTPHAGVVCWRYLACRDDEPAPAGDERRETCDELRQDWRDLGILLERHGFIHGSTLSQVQELIAQRDAAVKRIRELQGDERREVGEFTKRAIEEIADNWMYRATLHAQMACFYCNAVVEWMGDEGDEPVCEHFPDCLHLRARKLQEGDDEN